jgi:hypothetical protein
VVEVVVTKWEQEGWRVEVVGLGCGNKLLLKVKIGYQVDITSKKKVIIYHEIASKEGGKSSSQMKIQNSDRAMRATIKPSDR